MDHSAAAQTNVPQTGALGITHLDRFYKRTMANRSGRQQKTNAKEWMLDTVLFAGLNLAIEETVQMLFKNGPSLAEFEKWILDRNDGHIAPERIARINAATEGHEVPEAQKKVIAAIEKMPSVLSADDLAFWEENGYVIVPGVISKEESKAAETVLWQNLRMDANDPNTWYPASEHQSIMVQFFHHPVLRRIHQSLRMHKAFAQLWGTADLWVNTDRMGFNPPERPGWSYAGPKLHWDTSLTQPIPFGIQGILYLTDTAENQGAFCCVPGFHKRVGEWLKNLPPRTNPRETILNTPAKPIAAQTGDLILWHQALPHAASPNRAARPRMVHYVTMFPCQPEPEREWL